MIRSELPHYCFPDGLPKKKKGKRVQQTVSELGAEDGAEGPGPSKKAKYVYIFFSKDMADKIGPNPSHHQQKSII
jgi:hypothetical protein